MRTLVTVAVLAIATLAPSAAHAERAAGITGNTRLVTFDTLTPGTASVQTMTGFQAADERVVGLDLRPATGELIALTVPVGVLSNATVRTYHVDINSAALTFIGSIPGTVASASDRSTGIDFNPIVDRLRVVQSND